MNPLTKKRGVVDPQSSTKSHPRDAQKTAGAALQPLSPSLHARTTSKWQPRGRSSFGALWSDFQAKAVRLHANGCSGLYLRPSTFELLSHGRPNMATLPTRRHLGGESLGPHGDRRARGLRTGGGAIQVTPPDRLVVPHSQRFRLAGT